MHKFIPLDSDNLEDELEELLALASTSKYALRAKLEELLAYARAGELKSLGAPFNGARDCSLREPYMNNGMRAMQRASVGGTGWGAKPAKKRAAVAQPRAADRTSPAT